MSFVPKILCFFWSGFCSDGDDYYNNGDFSGVFMWLRKLSLVFVAITVCVISACGKLRNSSTNVANAQNNELKEIQSFQGIDNYGEQCSVNLHKTDELWISSTFTGSDLHKPSPQRTDLLNAKKYRISQTRMTSEGISKKHVFVLLSSSEDRPISMVWHIDGAFYNECYLFEVH